MNSISDMNIYAVLFNYICQNSFSDNREYLKKIGDEYVAVTNDITSLEVLQKEKIGREKLVDDGIER
jgi:hypothetical protein